VVRVINKGNDVCEVLETVFFREEPKLQKLGQGGNELIYDELMGII
jgi:hypothetical protein